MPLSLYPSFRTTVNNISSSPTSPALALNPSMCTSDLFEPCVYSAIPATLKVHQKRPTLQECLLHQPLNRTTLWISSHYLGSYFNSSVDSAIRRSPMSTQMVEMNPLCPLLCSRLLMKNALRKRRMKRSSGRGYVMNE